MDGNGTGILCLGSTGTGKSTTIKKMTGIESVQATSSEKSVTQECSIYYPKTEISQTKSIRCSMPNLSFANQISPIIRRRISFTSKDREKAGLPWIDTPGLDDSSNYDNETFKNNLLFLKSKNITRLQGIIWCVLPSVRCTATLEKQARYIQDFSVVDKSVWENVIIISKGTTDQMLVNDDCKGALEAAERASRAAKKTFVKPSQIGYLILETRAFSVKLTNLEENHKGCPRDRVEEHTVYTCNNCKPEFKRLKEFMNVKTDEEIQKILKEELGKLRPIQIISKDSKCFACGDVNDRRLMSEYCHFEKTRSHPGRIVKIHRKLGKANHEHPVPIFYHPGKETHSVWNTIRGWFSDVPDNEIIYSCCKSSNEGCKRKWRCCEMNYEAGNNENCMKGKTMYPCCQKTRHMKNGQPRHTGKTDWRWEGSLLNPFYFPRCFTCCWQKVNEFNIGCKNYFECCASFEEEMPCGVENLPNYRDDAGCTDEWNCCGKQASGDACADICVKCRRRWGEGALNEEGEPCHLLQVKKNGEMEEHRDLRENTKSKPSTEDFDEEDEFTDAVEEHHDLINE